jgi:hypothetical protein
MLLRRITILAAFALAFAASGQARANPLDGYREQEINVNAFRSPSMGVEYKAGFASVHVGMYPTVISKDQFGHNRTTWFFKAGFTFYPYPVSILEQRPSSPYFSIAYVRGLQHGFRNGVMTDVGFRWIAYKGLDLRLGVGLLQSPPNGIRINPTPGIGWSFRLPRLGPDPQLYNGVSQKHAEKWQ